MSSDEKELVSLSKKMMKQLQDFLLKFDGYMPTTPFEKRIILKIYRECNDATRAIERWVQLKDKGVAERGRYGGRW
ncbi:MAG: hypothetical protein ACTSR0_03945 [Candidatus Asgardarchaeia archaeon]